MEVGASTGSPPPESATPKTWYAALTILWALLVVAAFITVLRYSTNAGALATPPQHIVDAPQTVMAHFFVHPKCPCTLASAEMLDRVLTRAGITRPGTVTAHIFQPTAVDHRWARTELVARLERIPAVRCIPDLDGSLSRAFGITTSGHLLVYVADELIFTGGITPSRAHEGDCDASSAAASAFRGKASERRWPTYGCTIRDQACAADCEARQ
jgi:hypothetical protein